MVFRLKTLQACARQVQILKHLFFLPELCIARSRKPPALIGPEECSCLKFRVGMSFNKPQQERSSVAVNNVKPSSAVVNVIRLLVMLWFLLLWFPTLQPRFGYPALPLIPCTCANQTNRPFSQPRRPVHEADTGALPASRLCRSVRSVC